MIGSILVIGILVTFATASFVKSNENVPESAENSLMSGSEFPEAFKETNPYGGQAELFSADIAEPGEGSARKEDAGAGSTGPDSSESQASVNRNGIVPEEEEMELKSSGESAPADQLPQPAFESSGEASAREPVISPISPDTKSRLFNSADAMEGAAYYRKHLEDLDAQIKKMREESGNSNTYSMKALADKELKLWNRELDGIYAAAAEVLTEEDRQALETSQQAWIKSRDARAEEAAQKYSGGSLEELEYTASLAESARVRAYDLVEEYAEVLPPGDGQ